MAGKRRRYILTETAEQDFREARGWSLSRWGRELTKQYFTDLHQCAERIARNSERFAPMEHVPNTAELSVYPIREHYLVYVPIREKRIAIVALIRQTRDVPAILNANGFVIRRQLKKILAKPAPVNSAWNSFFFRWLKNGRASARGLGSGHSAGDQREPGRCQSLRALVEHADRQDLPPAQ